MGKCMFCGAKAGLFRRQHSECQDKHAKGIKSFVSKVSEGILLQRDPQLIQTEIEQIAIDSFIDKTNKIELLVKGWEASLESFLADHVVDQNEESILIKYMDHFGLNQDSFQKNEGYNRLIKSLVLRDLLEGKVSNRVRVSGNLPFALQKSETILWVFPSAQGYEERTRREYVGRSRGVSVRIMKGVYYRVGEFRGHPVETQYNASLGVGPFCITNKHVYFSGQKAIRLPYKKIICIEPYSDGVGLQKEGTTAKPLTFVTGDGWFTYNLLSNVSAIA